MKKSTTIITVSLLLLTSLMATEVEKTAETFYSEKCNTCLDKAQTDRDMVNCLYTEVLAIEKEMGYIEKEIVKGLDMDASEMKEAQKIWKEYRDSECLFQLSLARNDEDSNYGGTASEMEYMTCVVEQTEKRINMLGDRADRIDPDE